ncbi:MAG: hypothetical protein AAGA56_29820 [Myxococcota bacterium]
MKTQKTMKNARVAACVFVACFAGGGCTTDRTPDDGAPFSPLYEVTERPGTAHALGSPPSLGSVFEPLEPEVAADELDGELEGTRSPRHTGEPIPDTWRDVANDDRDDLPLDEVASQSRAEAMGGELEEPIPQPWKEHSDDGEPIPQPWHDSTH